MNFSCRFSDYLTCLINITSSQVALYKGYLIRINTQSQKINLLQIITNIFTIIYKDKFMGQNFNL